MADVRGNTDNLSVAKNCFATMKDYSWGIWLCSSSVSSNCYIYIFRESPSVGLIEITEISTGQTTKYKRGYSDNDFIVVS